jgi:hypothetical protein
LRSDGNFARPTQEADAAAVWKRRTDEQKGKIENFWKIDYVLFEAENEAKTG